jgi:enoyl-CoA hydratase
MLDTRNGQGQFTLYEVRGSVAWVRMNRPQYANTQNYRMLDELDGWFRKAVEDDEVRVIVLAGEGKHFSSGHDLGTPDCDNDFERERKGLWDNHLTKDKGGAERQYTIEQDVYLGLCRRWQDIPKPTIAMVQGACIAGGLMLAFACDLVVASDDAFFQDPVLAFGVPGVEYMPHMFEIPTRIAREFLYLGQKMKAPRAYEVGMINRAVPRDQLEAEVEAIAERLAAIPPFGFKLAKQAMNMIDDGRGKRTVNDGIFAMHHLAHAHSQLTTGNLAGGLDPKKVKAG